MGFDPGTPPGSRPEPKADAQPLSHPGAPDLIHFLSGRRNIEFTGSSEGFMMSYIVFPWYVEVTRKLFPFPQYLSSEMIEIVS